MKYRLLGHTNLNVACIALGTAELGLDYGIRKSGKPDRPSEDDAIRLLHYTIDRGINLFDTAPAYGTSEEMLGKVIESRPDCYIATKVSIPVCEGKLLTGKKLKEQANSSLQRSLHALRRDTLDIVQIHNATLEVIERGEMMEILLEAQRRGEVGFLGASVYTEAEALAVIKSGYFDVLQVAYSILDQRMARSVFPAAKEAGVGIINRSALLKGVLTPRANWLPPELTSLRQASEEIINTFDISCDVLPQMALRFCLCSDFVQAILVGASNEQEIDSAIDAALEGPLDEEKLTIAVDLALHDEHLLNPSYWPIP